MTQEDLVKRLKHILCWVPQNTLGYEKIKDLITQLGGRV